MFRRDFLAYASGALLALFTRLPRYWARKEVTPEPVSRRFTLDISADFSAMQAPVAAIMEAVSAGRIDSSECGRWLTRGSIFRKERSVNLDEDLAERTCAVRFTLVPSDELLAFVAELKPVTA